MKVTVAGPAHLLQKVQVALGKLKQFTVLTNDDNSYDGDDESDSDKSDKTKTATLSTDKPTRLTLQSDTERCTDIL